MRTAIIDYGAGNTRSVSNALTRLGEPHTLTADPAVLGAAERVILPGVGAAASAMRGLAERGLTQWVRECEQPLLGICLGMQLLYEHSTEGDTPCLGLLPGRVTELPPGPQPVPHMGWNTLSTGEMVYFVHSYGCPVGPATVATGTYNGQTFSAIVRAGHRWGMQFHPEKSGPVGAELLSQFLQA